MHWWWHPLLAAAGAAGALLLIPFPEPLAQTQTVVAIPYSPAAASAHLPVRAAKGAVKATTRSGPGAGRTGATVPVSATTGPELFPAGTRLVGPAPPSVGAASSPTDPFSAAWASATAYEVADASVPVVSLFQQPGGPRTGVAGLPNPTMEHVPLVFLVREDRGDWLLVQVPRRPNQALAWVRRSDVTLRAVPYHVLVELGAHRLTVLYGSDVVRQQAVAVGSPSDPTPTGQFYIDAAVRLTPATGAYGAGQLSVAGFSDVLHTFAGGVGQIALHGTDRPDLIGRSVSDGCVRLANPIILALLDLLATGTPVTIVA